MSDHVSVPDNPVPEVYVLWHPACAFGEQAARAIYAWLRPGNGLGPHVYYRCLPAVEAQNSVLPPPLPGEARGPAMKQAGTENLQVVLPVIDDNMIADGSWRHWLAQLASRQIAQLIVPIALDSTAFNAPPKLRELNFLRPAGRTDEERIASLLKQLTESLCNLLLGKGKSRTAPKATSDQQPKIKIFLSHAKSDGAEPARRVRDYIYSQTQIAAFYDENDIPYGSPFARVLDADLEGELTVAMVVVRTQRYAARPWCRRELSLFRRPRRESSSANRWRLGPVLVVDALVGTDSTPGIPELGNAPILRWADRPGLEEKIVTTLLRDTLLAELHRAIGRSRADDPANAVINWLPDPTSILPIVREAGRGLTIHHPGRSLSGLELDILDDLFPDTHFRSFEGV